MRMTATVHSITSGSPKSGAKKDTVTLQHHEAIIAELKARAAELRAIVADAEALRDAWRDVAEQYRRALLAEKEAREFIMQAVTRAAGRAELKK